MSDVSIQLRCQISPMASSPLLSLSISLTHTLSLTLALSLPVLKPTAATAPPSTNKSRVNPQPHATANPSPRHLFLNIPHQNVQKQLRQRFRHLVIFLPLSLSLRIFPEPCRADCLLRDSSPQGRIFQVEYALEAIKQGSVAVGLVSKTHAVLVALKVQPTLMEPQLN